jgi:hypothetical protein
MARILFAWEMGANYGHVSGFAPVASSLLERGHELVAVVQNAHDSRHFFDKRVAVLQAPLQRKTGVTPKDRPQQVTYADLIKHLGYEDPVELATLLRVWRSTYQVARPDLVLYDSAPTAQLASRSFDFVKVTIGSAFSVPPRTAPLPLLFKNLKVPFAEHEKREGAVVKIVNEALSEFGLGSIAALRDALGSDADLLRGYPELDHYGSRKGGEWFGAGFSLDSGVEVEWPPGDGPKIFLYLRPPVRAEMLLKQLAPLGYRLIAVMPNLVGQISGRPPANLRMIKDPARLRSLVASADVAVCHSAVGTGAAFLLGGVPILTVPTNAEQAMIAARVEEQGFGLSLRDTASADYKTPIKRLLSDPSFRQKAGEFARRYPETSEQRTARVCDRIERLLSERRAPSAAAAS